MTTPTALSSRIVLIFAMAFFVLGIGAKDCSSPGSSPANSAATADKPFCYTDPPLGCAAFCSDVGTVSFTPQCKNVDASDREIQFEVQVIEGFNMKIAQGYEVCPQASPLLLTPCSIGFPPVEHPDQDHAVCQTPPLDCSL